MRTELGSIVLELRPDAAPKTVANFIRLVESGFYSSTPENRDKSASMYRYEPNFCFQGGGWPVKGSPFPPVPLEYKLPNVKYAVYMARTADPDSATSEFSIMLNDNSRWLGPKSGGGGDPYGYAVFAKVVGGFDVIEKAGELSREKRGGLVYLKKRIPFLESKVLK